MSRSAHATRIDRSAVAPVAIIVLLAFRVSLASSATVYFDPLQRVALRLSVQESTADGYLAWRFAVKPLDSNFELSSIDFATGDFAFSGDSLRQVNPFELPTIFTDNNAAFPPGEDDTSDTQFLLPQSSIVQIPNSAAESSTNLKAAFTGFPPVVSESQPFEFAQVVTPEQSTNQLYGAFVLRPRGGGVGTLVNFGPIDFKFSPGDFNYDGAVELFDLLQWQSAYGLDDFGDSDFDNDSDGKDFLNWQQNLAGSPDAAEFRLVPEPTSCSMLALLSILLAAWRRSAA